MKLSTADVPLSPSRYHLHHEGGHAHIHLPTWHLASLAVGLIFLVTLSSTFFYRLSHTPVPTVRPNRGLIQPAPPASPPPSAKTPAQVSPPAAPLKIEAYNTGLAVDPGLQHILDAYNAATPPAGAVVLDITDKKYATIEPDQIRTAASLYKLFVARELYYFRAQGKLAFDQTVTVTQTAANQDNFDPNLPVGTSIQISECLRRMIVISDNACGYLLGSIVGWNNVNETLHIKGYAQTSLGSDQLTSAGDVSLLLRRMAEGQMIDEASSHDLEAVLFEQQLNAGLPALLPPGVIGHKTGNLDGLVHDAGLVRTKTKTYVIVVLSGPWSSTDEANNSIAKLSRQVYDYILNYNP